jgi:hypothetical protein
MRQESRHFWFGHLPGMALPVEQNKAPDPIGVGLFGSNAEVFTPDDATNLVEQFRLVRRERWG